MTAPVIQLTGLSKKYCTEYGRSLGYGVLDILGEFIPPLRSTRLRRSEFWGLDDVSLTVSAGEAVAVVGHNGSGKTTLLKLVHGLLMPDAGRVKVSGRVVALIELGIGFNPHLSGNENVELSARLHGLTRVEARAILPAVIAFAELETYADSVLQSYSAGMRARLAFALATQLRADVMLIDEVLAVGDLPFQRKCLIFMREFIASGGSLMLVSHALNHIHSVCSRAILIDHGRMVAAGDVGSVIDHYLSLQHRAVSSAASGANGSVIEVTDLSVVSDNISIEVSESEIVVELKLQVHERIRVLCGFGIWTEDEWTLATASFDHNPHWLNRGQTIFRCKVSHFPLAMGRYRLRPIIADAEALQSLPLAGAFSQGIMLSVSSETDVISQNLRQLGQIARVDADWLPPAHQPAV